jgi:hypothetical protein
LAQSGLNPDLAEEVLQFLLLRSVEALFHGGRIKSVAKYPKSGYDP